MAITPGTPASATSAASDPYARIRACTSASPSADAAGSRPGPAPGSAGRADASAHADRQAFSTRTGTLVAVSSRPRVGPSASCWLEPEPGSSKIRYPCGPFRTGPATEIPYGSGDTVIPSPPPVEVVVGPPSW